MTIPICKHYPEMDGLMNIADAKNLFGASSKIQKFIEYTSQSLSRKISSSLYNTIETDAAKSCEFEFHISSIEGYAEDHEKDNNCEIRVTENILEKIAFRIAELFKENDFCARGYIVPNDRELARIEIKGWAENLED